MKKKVKEAHRFADFEICKANLLQRKKYYTEWLKSSATGVKNWQVLLLIGIVVYNILSFLSS